MVIKRKNNDIYILANSDNINGKQIYHFINTKIVDYWTSDDNRKSLNEKNSHIFSMFCTKENGKYVEIEDRNEINNLLVEFGMIIGPMIANNDYHQSNATDKKVKFEDFNPQQLDETDSSFFRKEQIENFKQIKEKLGVELDLDDIKDKLKKLKIYTIQGDMPHGMTAFYCTQRGKEGVCFTKNTIKDKTKKLHETTHYLAGQRYTKLNMFSQALLEGMNENVVCDFMNEDASNIHIAKENIDTQQDNENGKKSDFAQASTQFNFVTKSTYQYYVSMVKQFEYIMGMKSYDSAINGNGKFLKAIIKELGPIDAILMSTQLNKLFSKQRELGRCTVGMVKSFQYLQNELLKKCFDKRFRSINNIIDAKKYMELLRNFETYRGKITYLKKDGTIVEDNTFKKYYQERYQALIYKFQEKSSVLEEYTYKEQKYKPTVDEVPRHRENIIRISLLSNMIKETNGNVDSIPRNIQLSMKRNADFYFVYNINGNQLKRNELEKYSYIGKRRYLEWESIKLKNPESDFYEQCSKFIDDMHNKGREFDDETLDINYTEEEIQNEYRVFEEQEKMKEEMQEKKREVNQLKKITFIDKIRNKINSIFNRRKNKRDESDTSKELPIAENKENETDKLSSWDLRNWSREEIIDSVMREYEQKKADKNLHKKNEYNSQSDEYYK